MRKNVASQTVGSQMTTAADGTVFIGAVTVHVTGDGGTQATGSVGSGACTHEGNGYHSYAPAQAETNFDHVAFTFVGTGAIAVTVQIYTGFPQTGDSFARLGAPAGASVSADVAAVKTETASLQTDTNDIQTRLPAALVSGRIDASAGAMATGVITTAAFAAGAIDNAALANNVIGASKIASDALTAAKFAADVTTELQNGLATASALTTVAGNVTSILADTNELQTDWSNGGRLDLILDARASQTSVDALTVGASPDVLADTTIATLASQTSFTLTAGSADDDAYNGMAAIFTDQSTAAQKWVGFVSDYTGSTKTVTLESAPGFTIATGDTIAIMAAGGSTSHPVAVDVTLIEGVDATDQLDAHAAAGLDAAGVRAAVGLATANLDTQLADLPTNAELATALGTADDAILTAVADLPTNAELATALGTADDAVLTAIADLPTNAELATALAAADDAVLAAVATVDGNVDAIKVVTDKLDTAVELDAAVYRFTTNALENAPAGGGGTSDWTTGEKEQIRHRLGIDGDVDAPAATPSLATAANLATVAGYLDTEIAAIKAKTDALPADPADASDIAAAFSGVNTKLDTIDDLLDTEVAAIKTKTDQLTFTAANKVDAGVLRVGTTDLVAAGTGGQGYGA